MKTITIAILKRAIKKCSFDFNKKVNNEKFGITSNPLV